MSKITLTVKGVTVEYSSLVFSGGEVQVRLKCPEQVKGQIVEIFHAYSVNAHRS